MTEYLGIGIAKFNELAPEKFESVHIKFDYYCNNNKVCCRIY